MVAKPSNSSSVRVKCLLLFRITLTDMTTMLRELAFLECVAATFQMLPWRGIFKVPVEIHGQIIATNIKEEQRLTFSPQSGVKSCIHEYSVVCLACFKHFKTAFP